MSHDHLREAEALRTAAVTGNAYLKKSPQQTDNRKKQNNAVATMKKDRTGGKDEPHNGLDSDASAEDDTTVEKGELEANEKSGEKKEDQDVFFIQDVGFTVKIQSPGVEMFDIQVTGLLFGTSSMEEMFSFCHYSRFYRCPAWNWCKRFINC